MSARRTMAAGAPSEFTIRAPILGGLYTVMVQFSEGPKGVFLLVDDDIDYCSLLSDYLESEGFLVDTRNDGEEGFDALSSSFSGCFSSVKLTAFASVISFSVLLLINTGLPLHSTVID